MDEESEEEEEEEGSKRRTPQGAVSDTEDINWRPHGVES